MDGIGEIHSFCSMSLCECHRRERYKHQPHCNKPLTHSILSCLVRNVTGNKTIVMMTSVLAIYTTSVVAKQKHILACMGRLTSCQCLLYFSIRVDNSRLSMTTKTETWKLPCQQPLRFYKWIRLVLRGNASWKSPFHISTQCRVCVPHVKSTKTDATHTENGSTLQDDLDLSK